MATLTIQLQQIHHTGEVASFIDITRALGFDGMRHFPLLVTDDGISVSASIDFKQAHIPAKDS